MKRSVALLTLVLLFWGGTASLSVASAPKEFSNWRAWKAEIDRSLKDLRRTSQITVQQALLRHVESLVRADVKPRKRYLRELETLLEKTPPGTLFNTIINTLLERPSQSTVKILFRALSATRVVDYLDRELPEEQLESRARTIEVRLRDLGDRAYRRRLGGVAPKLSRRAKALLRDALSSDREREVRSAAYLLGGWGIKEAAPVLREAFATSEESWTRAILVENLGRTDVSGAEAEIFAAALGSGPSERLAAIPLLGRVKTAEAQKMIETFLNDKKWFVRRAALLACRHRRDVTGMDFLLARFPKEIPRLRQDIYASLSDITGGVLPPDPAEWEKWWSYARKDFKAANVGVAAKNGKTELVLDGLQYFGVEIHSDSLALLFDVSGSMGRSNVQFTSQDKKKGGESNAFHAASEEIRSVLKRYTQGARFNLIAFGDEVIPFQRKVVKRTRGSVNKADRFLKKLKPGGETNTYGALELALADPNVDTIVLLSDGHPTRGRRVEPSDILEAVARINRFRGTVIHTVQIGEKQPFMRQLSQGNGGRYREISLAGAAAEPRP